MVHVAYKGAAPAVADVMAGQVDASFATLGSVLPQVQAGKLTALAGARADSYPHVRLCVDGGISTTTIGPVAAAPLSVSPCPL